MPFTQSIPPSPSISGTAGANDLIQAGIMGSVVPCVGSAPVDQFDYTGNTFWACPWTTVIEDGIVTEGPVPDLTFYAGDDVEVYLSGRP